MKMIITNTIVRQQSIQALDNRIHSTMHLLDKVQRELSPHHSTIDHNRYPVHRIIEEIYPHHRSIPKMMIMNHVRFYYQSEEELWVN